MILTPGSRIGCLLVLLLVATLPLLAQQPPSKFDIARARDMLSVIKDDLRKNYYDVNYHGMDVDARFKAADDTLKQAMPDCKSLEQVGVTPDETNLPSAADLAAGRDPVLREMVAGLGAGLTLAVGLPGAAGGLGAGQTRPG